MREMGWGVVEPKPDPSRIRPRDKIQCPICYDGELALRGDGEDGLVCVNPECRARWVRVDR